ncbi:uncharacterized protein M6B38_307780 [Iris pallida]|uniref:Uncharacterized protein n=1 Tax=Iris pallida TaxID=29817 RepID=A0AAX6GTB8_IRIPA|nr:uncharacterized protein M6B38_348300 [Iris pallida]KAJ6841277.1 uncharacterized protein M6B38_307780 [Iris pallida]
MSELCSSSDTCHLLYTLLLDYLLLLVAFLTSHPIHSAYFLFFSPYLLPLVSFLSPLILSTSILLLLLFLFLHSTHEPHEANGNAAPLLDQLGSTVVAFIGNVFEWEFETMHDVYNDVGIISCEGEDDDIFLDSSEKELFDTEVAHSETDCRVKEVQEENLQRASSSVPADSPSWTRVGEEHGGGGSGRAKESLQRDGSMRKEKEWKRTLACKLYEERMTFKLCEDRTVVDGAEEMDLLWEAYEVDATENTKKQTHRLEEEEDGDEEEEESVNLCCLQALRLSTGKMNLGVRRPNLEKFSRAFKGIGLFRGSGRRSRKC